MSYANLDLVILKHIISSSKNGVEFANNCDTKLFSSDVWNFASLIVSHIKTYKQPPTLRILTERLLKSNNDKLLDSVKKIWTELDKIDINEAEYQHDVQKIRARFAESQVLAAKEIFSKFSPGNVDVGKATTDMQRALQNIKSVNRKTVYESKEIKDYLPTFVDNFNAKKNNPDFDRGLMTKYAFLDYATNGLKPADFVVIAGETGFGKSLLLNNIAIQIWLQDNKIPFDGETIDFTSGKDIIYFSLEMPYEDCFNRLLSRLSGVRSRKIENGDLTKEEFKKIKACLDFISRYPYKFKIVDITEACANDLETALIDGGENYDAIFVDYIGIMSPNENHEEQDWLRQGNITKELRFIARKYKKVMFSAVQLNRKTAKESSETIGLHRLARSATIATHCTHVLQIESRGEQESKYFDMIIHLIKNRKGPKVKGILIKDLACASLLDKNDGESEQNYDDVFKDQDDISEDIENLEL